MFMDCTNLDRNNQVEERTMLVGSLFRTIVCVSFILIFVVPFNVSASYSNVYDEKLNALSVTDPKLTIKTTKEQLMQAELQGDFERQLVLYFYMAEAYSTLSNNSETTKIVAKALALARMHNSIRFISEFIGFESFVMVYKGDLRGASKKANLALQFAKEIDDYRLIASMLSIRAQAHLAIENYSLATDNLFTHHHLPKFSLAFAIQSNKISAARQIGKLMFKVKRVFFPMRNIFLKNHLTE